MAAIGDDHLAKESFARDCRRLRELYWRLEYGKHATGNHENAGKPPNPPGSKTPGGWASDLAIDGTIRLRELVFDAKGYITPGMHINDPTPPRLIGYLLFHLDEVCDLDFVDGIADEIRQQIRLLEQKLEPTPVDESNFADVKAPPALLERIIFDKFDIRVDRKTITTWGREGKIRTFIHDGAKVFSFWEVVRYKQQRMTNGTGKDR